MIPRFFWTKDKNMANESGSAAMNLVVSNMQQRAAASDDNVPTALWAEKQLEGRRRMESVSRTADQAAHGQLTDLHKNISLVASMNESANANNYMSTVAASQKSQIDQGMVGLNREQTLSSRHLLDYVFLKDRYMIWAHLLKATIIVIAILFLCGALWSMDRLDVVSTLMLALVTVCIYLVYLAYQMALLGRRRRESGRKMKWGATGTMDSDMARLTNSSRSC